MKIDSITGHGGLFKTKGRRTEYSGGSHERADFRDGDGGRGRRLGHGASGGIHAFQKDGQSLGDYLDSRVFAERKSETMEPDPSDVAGFETYTKQYQACLCRGKSCGTGVLKRCRCNAAIADAAKIAAENREKTMLEELKKAVYEANMDLPRYGLVTFTWGNVRNRQRKRAVCH